MGSVDDMVDAFNDGVHTMSKTIQGKATEAATLSLAQWGTKLKRAAKAELSAASKVYFAVLEARGAFDIQGKAGEKAVRDTARAAFESAGMEKRTAAKRVSDAVAILKAPAIPGDAPANLQRCADAIRAARPESERSKRSAAQAGSTNRGKAGAEKAPDKVLSKAAMIKALKGTLDGFRRQAADEEAAALVDALRSVLDEPDH